MDGTEVLRDIVLFSNLPDDLFDKLVESACRRSFNMGDAIFLHGDAPDFLYIVEGGAVDVVVPSSAGELVVASFESGSFFGELAVFDRQPRSATARALTAVTLICIPLQAVNELLDQHPPVARQFISALTQRLRSADELLSRLQVKNVNELAEENMTLGERVADKVARFGGSWTFIISFGIFLALWMAGNTAYLLSSPPDPFPYIFLNLILSCIAALQAPVIMMSQNRQASKDRLQADLEFEINVKAEIAVQQLHRKIDELRATVLQHLLSQGHQRRI